MDVPVKWRNALAAVQAGGFPEAVIAGGALRDLDHNKPVKDVDVFVVDRGDATLAMLNKALHGAGNVLGSDDANTESGSVDRLSTVIDYTPVDENEPPIQVIVMPASLYAGSPDDPSVFLQYMLDDFDIGLCRIGFDGKSVIRTEEYERDVADGTITILKAESVTELGRSRARAERIGQKYPDHKIVDCVSAAPAPDDYVAVAF